MSYFAMNDLLILYNPYYQENVIELHLQVLKARGQVAFGKVRSKLRDKFTSQNNGFFEDCSNKLKSSNLGFLQLFLTDYASLYVAKVVGIEKEVISEFVPDYYKQKNFSIEAYFIITDLRELVRDDFALVRDKYLAHFSTPQFNNHTYALYGNTYTYPLLIKQKEEVNFFEDSQKHFLNLFKSDEFLHQKQILIDYVFGETYLYAMHPDSFDNLIYAELEFNENKDDKSYDFSAVILRYAKCFEQECYILIKKLIQTLSQKDSEVLNLSFTQMGKATELKNLLTHKATLGAYNYIIDNMLKAHIQRHCSEEFISFTKRFSRQITFIQNIRNPVAHSQFASLKQAHRLRSRLIGVGMSSQLVQMIKTRLEFPEYENFK